MFISVIDLFHVGKYYISILYEGKMFVYFGLMDFNDYGSAYMYCKKYIKNIEKCSQFFGESVWNVKKNYCFK